MTILTHLGVYLLSCIIEMPRVSMCYRNISRLSNLLMDVNNVAALV